MPSEGFKLSSSVVLRVADLQGQQWGQPYKAEAELTYQHFERIYARGKKGFGILGTARYDDCISAATTS